MLHPSRSRPFVISTLVLVTLLAGCGGTSSAPTPASPAPPTSADLGDVPDSLIVAIREDAAGRTNASAVDVAVTMAEAVTWNDGALGCPEPDMGYTQALVEGYHVVVEVAGRELDYRAGAAGRFRLCEDPESSVSP